MPQYSVDVIQEVLDLLDAGRTQGEVSRQTKIPQPTISRWVHNRRIDPPADPITIVHIPSGSPDGSPGLPQSAPGSPDIARQSDVDALATRVEVLEAFIASLQQHQTTPPGSPNGSPVVHPVHSGSPSGSPTHKRGFVMADDLFEAIHIYATAHRLQVKDVVDLALRRFFLQVGQEVGADA